MKRLGYGVSLCALCCFLLSCADRGAVVLENGKLRLSLERQSGTLTELGNQLTGEAYRIQGDDFRLQADTFELALADCRLESLEESAEEIRVNYDCGRRKIGVTYTLGADDHFAEKRLRVVSDEDYGLRELVVSRPSFAASGLKLVPYPYQKNVTYFGRTTAGGFFTGLELPFDSSKLEGTQVTLGYVASLKVKAGEELQSEPIYLGVYRRGEGDQEQEGLPLPSESEAMVAMTSAIMGPPRHGLVPMACGAWSEMEHFTYQDQKQVRGDMKSLDFLLECGIDWVSDSHPWGGETAKMNALVEGQDYAIGPLYRQFLEHAQKIGIKLVMWPTINNTHPWWLGKGKPFRPDKPDWLMVPGGRDYLYRLEDGREFKGKAIEGNCLANQPFFDWLMRINLQGMETGFYSAWGMDGDFFGGPGFVIPADCPSATHDHLPGDSNYACERALNRMFRQVREAYPEIHMEHARPGMDLGIWSFRDADVSFTIDEFAEVKPLPGFEDQPVNVSFGDKIRRWSRIRVHQHFFPHYLDQPQVFVAPESVDWGQRWPSERIDYLMLSALSSSPKHLYYIPTKTGIPEEDKLEIKKWLDWGRQNIRYLLVRKDLPDWPGVGSVDGSAHLVSDRGYIFLFNPNKGSLGKEFSLTGESIGLESEGSFRIRQTYPVADETVTSDYGETVSWVVPGETAVVLEVSAD